MERARRVVLVGEEAAAHVPTAPDVGTALTVGVIVGVIVALTVVAVGVALGVAVAVADGVLVALPPDAGGVAVIVEALVGSVGLGPGVGVLMGRAPGTR